LDTDLDGVCEIVDRCLGDDATGDEDSDGVCDDLDPCSGHQAFGDSDNDGVCDDWDWCEGDDTSGDDDDDDVCNDLDVCVGDDALGDADVDGICDDLDACFGDNASGNVDGDGVCDDLDVCHGDDASGDIDFDGICDNLDACDGDDATGDLDLDGICDDLDNCPGAGGLPDLDVDGLCDDRDVCFGDNSSGDVDGDGICNDNESCTAASADIDLDGVCDDLDVCDGDDAVGDIDGDGTCDDLDECTGNNLTGDRDLDGICDGVDPCDDDVVAPGTACTLHLPVPENLCAGMPTLFEGRHTGFVTCPDGALNRLFSTDGWLFPETQDETSWNPDYFYGNPCLDDATCTAGPYGACVSEAVGDTGHHSVCTYGCDSDLDCGSSEVCLPPSVGWRYAYSSPRTFEAGHPDLGRGTCIEASCTTGSDCASGECGYDWRHWSCGQDGDPILTCRKSTDTCVVSATCSNNGDDWLDGMCEATGGGGFNCSVEETICGRPFVDVSGDWVVADVVSRSDWSDEVGADVQGLDAPTRAHLAEHWIEVAQMEHASVASFARHVMELLSLGAPADLVEGATAAQADEIEHARMAFGLAKDFGAEDVGPGALPWELPRIGAEAILRALVEEGCIGETVAAAEADVCARRAADPVVARVLFQIAAEEERHAALAWRTARWLVEAYPALQAVVEDAVAEARSQAIDVLAVPGPFATHGLVTGTERRALRTRVLQELIDPCVVMLRQTSRAA
jgi:hypothetical protein